MSKLRLGWIIAILLFALPLVNALPPTNGYEYFTFNDNKTGIKTGVTASITGTILTPLGKIGNGTGVTSGNGKYIDYAHNSQFDMWGNWSVSFFANITYCDASSVVVNKITGAGAGWRIRCDNANLIRIVIGAGTILSSTAIDVSNGAWVHWAYVWDNKTKNVTTFKNGALVATNTKSDAQTISGTNPTLRLFAQNEDGNLNPTAMIDELYFFNRTLTLQEILDLNASTTSYPFTQTSNFFYFNGSSYPADNSQFSQNYMNFTQNATIINNTVNCSVLLNGVINETKQYSNTSNQPYFFNISFDKQLAVPKEYNYTISCRSLTDNITTNTTQARFYLDNVMPSMQINLNNFSVFASQNNLTAQINLSDDLYINSLNLSIDDVQIYGNNGLSGLYSQINISSSINSLNDGLHNLKVRYADGHSTELNKAEQNISFYKVNASVNYQTTAGEGAYNIFTLNLEMINLSFLSHSGYMIWNNNLYTAINTNLSSSKTEYNSSMFTNTSGLINWTYVFYINGIYQNLTGTQTISAISLINCSQTANKTMLYKFFIEGTSTPILSNITANFTYWSDYSSYTKNTYLTLNNIYNFTICVNPNINVWTDYNVRYTSYGYTNRNKQSFNYSILPNQTINLYLSTNTGSLIVNLIDQYNQPLVGYQTDMYLNGNFLDSDMSDVDGNVIFDYDSDNKYQFKLYYGGALYYDSGEVVISSNPYVLKVSKGSESTLGEILPLQNIQYRLLNYNLSKIINFSWTNNGGNTGRFCLSVVNTNQNGNTNKVYNGCVVNTPPNSIVYNYSGLNGSIIAAAYVEGSINVLDTISVIFAPITDNLYEVMGLEAYLFAAIIILILSLAFAYLNPSAILIGADLGLFISMVITLIPISVGTIVILVVLSAIAIILMRT